MNETPDQRAKERPTPAEEFLIDSHTDRARRLMEGMASMIVQHLARERAGKAEQS